MRVRGGDPPRPHSHLRARAAASAPARGHGRRAAGSRRPVAVASIVAALVLATGCGEDARPVTPNVLIIMTEDQGAHAAYLGTPGVDTPHMDRLARGGVAFPNAFTVSPVCSPSKAALYTGRYPHANGLMANTVDYMRRAEELTLAQQRHPLYGLYRIDDDVPTLIEVVRRAGFFTGITGKLHVAPNDKFPFDRFLRTRGERAPASAAVTTFIEEAAALGRPWLLVHSIKPPHRPFPDSELENVVIDPEAAQPPAHLPDTPAVHRDWAEYLAAIALADQAVGATLDALHASGQSDRTLIVFTSDHGPAFQRGKMSLYDLGLRVPLVISGPGVASATRPAALVSTIDVMPTLLDLLGLPTPSGVQGRSLVPLLGGEADDATFRDRLIFAELSHGIPRPERGMQERSVYDGTWHLIHRVRPNAPRIVNNDLRRFDKWGNRTYGETIRRQSEFPEAWRMLSEVDNARLGGHPPRIELYHLGNDPHALHDLARDPAHAATVGRLMEAMRRFAGVDSGPPADPAQ